MRSKERRKRTPIKVVAVSPRSEQLSLRELAEQVEILTKEKAEQKENARRLAEKLGPLEKKKEGLAKANAQLAAALAGSREETETALVMSADLEQRANAAERREAILRQQARFQSRELQQLKRLLTGAVYIGFFAPLIRCWRKWWAPKRKRNSKRWRGVCCERSRMIGGWRCERCGEKLTEEMAIGHHIIEFCDGGTDTVDNCLLTCEACEKAWHGNGNGKNGNGHKR